MDELTQKQIKKLFDRWKKRDKLSLSLTFTGSIQEVENLKTPSQLVNRVIEKKKAILNQEEAESQELLPEIVNSFDEDFVTVTYRAISSTVLADRPIDFTNKAMLKKSVSALDGQTVFKDHNTVVDNWVGRVTKAYWDTKTEGVPPGINAELRLDIVKDPMTVRGVLQGAIHSASITVTFEWEPSHPNLMYE